MRKYISGTARREFERSLTEIRGVLPMVATRRKIHADLRNYVLGASILFLNAKLENYISDLFNGICQEACLKGVDATDIPPPLLGWLFLADGHLDRSKAFVAKNDEFEFIANTGNYLRTQLLDGRAGYVSPDRFKGIDDKSYPSVKNIKKMFKRIGIDNIFARLNRRLKRNSQLDVESLNSLRGSLAHSGISGTIPYGDVQDLLTKTQQFVVAIDKEVFFYLRAACPVDVWKV